MTETTAVTLRVIVVVSQTEVDECGSVEEAAGQSMRHGGMLDMEVLDPGGLKEPL